MQAASGADKKKWCWILYPRNFTDTEAVTGRPSTVISFFDLTAHSHALLLLKYPRALQNKIAIS